MSRDHEVAILGVGMHPWGKWGRDFTEYGLVAARAALADANLAWRDIQFVAGADTIRNGYPGFIAGATFAQKLGWTGVRVSSNYAACASGTSALHQARAQILAATDHLQRLGPGPTLAPPTPGSVTGHRHCHRARSQS